MGARVEYLGFAVRGAVREYALRVRHAQGEAHDFTLVIPNEAFVGHLVRYQDAPEVCFLKLQRELAACTDGLPASQLNVTDFDLEEYRVAHSPKTPPRRPRPTAGT